MNLPAEFGDRQSALIEATLSVEEAARKQASAAGDVEEFVLVAATTADLNRGFATACEQSQAAATKDGYARDMGCSSALH
jgi:hypothetical protein